MIFKVSENFKGSCVLPTLNKAIWANMTLSINDNDLYALDVKNAIEKGILTPVDGEYTKQMKGTNHDIMIVNLTDKVMVLGKIVLRPAASLPTSKDNPSMGAVYSAEENGYVDIVSYDIEEDEIDIKAPKKKKTVKKVAKKKKTITKKDNTPKSEEDMEVTPVVWNPKLQDVEEAKKVPRSEEVVRVDEDQDIEELKFIDKKDVKKKTKTKKKKTTKKRVAKKNTTKKKGIKAKKKKVKVIEPVGEVKIEKTSADGAIELDSRGNPIGDKPSDTLRHLIDELNAPEDVIFADQEQSQDRLNDRNDRG